jgi:hypothetical protein
MNTKAILALTTSALALPGIKPVTAETAPTESVISYNYTNYDEDPMHESDVIGGSLDRYKIKIHQLSVSHSFNEKYNVTFANSYESMSGASPWYGLVSNDKQYMAMSGATIYEKRNESQFGIRKYTDNGSLGLSYRHSTENDYESDSFSINSERNFNEDQFTFSTGFSYSSDDIFPSDSESYNRIKSASKTTKSFSASLTAIIDRLSLVQTGLTYTSNKGFLSDPYKLADRRPSTRNQLSWNTTYKKYFISSATTIEAGYRFYKDTFGIESQTLNFNWYIPVGSYLQLVPGVRYYSQSEADFYQLSANFIDTNYASTDFRLSSYGSLSYKLKINILLDDITIKLLYEDYSSDNSVGVYDGPSSAALLDFDRISVGFDYSF